MRVLLLGGSGQLGWELARALAPLGDILPSDRSDLDLASPDQVVSRVRAVRPDLVVNAAAYTAVDRAEAEPEVAHAVNAAGVAVLAEEAKRAGALLIHYSTDHVFDGAKDAPYTEDDLPRPINVYGQSKLAGERAIQDVDGRYLILRTSWVYSMRGRNFLLTMLRMLRTGGELRVVSDQIGAPTSAPALAEATTKLLTGHDLATLGASRGIYHMAAGGDTSWCGFAKEIAKLEGPEFSDRILPIPSSAYPTAARRPKNSRLSTDKLRDRFGVSLPQWETDLARCLRPTESF